MDQVILSKCNSPLYDYLVQSNFIGKPSNRIKIERSFSIENDVDSEDTPQEIYHLGEESLNALDSALGFKSLRSQYELNEFKDYDWVDNTDLYVDDEDYQMVLNRNHEVKIGNKYFKAISNNIIAVVNNGNIVALEQLRIYDIFTNNADIQFFNEETGEYENPPTIYITSQTARDCSNYKPLSHVSVLTPLSSAANQWTVQLRTGVYYPVDLPDYPGSYVSIIANYTVDWGEGTTSSFIAPFISGHTSLIHVYNQNLPPGGSVQKTINVSCQFIYPQSSTPRLDKLINECPQLINSPFFYSSATFMLTNPATQDCMEKNIKRKFYGAQLTWGGNTYRLYCKLKQKSDPFIGFSHVTSTVIFEKQKGNSWKKVMPVKSLIIKLRGNIYTENTCSNLYGTMNNVKSTSKKQKLKIRESQVGSGFESRRSLPLAINADFIWTYNSGPSSIGEYNKVLKP